MRSRRLLLRNAMQRAAFLNQIEAIDRNDFPAREKLSDDSQGAVIVFPLTERRHQNRMVQSRRTRRSARAR